MPIAAVVCLSPRQSNLYYNASGNRFCLPKLYAGSIGGGVTVSLVYSIECPAGKGDSWLIPQFVLLASSQPLSTKILTSRISKDEADCVVVDPGLEPDEILRYLDEEKLVPAAILITHGHSDHIAGNEALKERFPDCPIVISHGDEPKLTNPMLNLSGAFGRTWSARGPMCWSARGTFTARRGWTSKSAKCRAIPAATWCSSGMPASRSWFLAATCCSPAASGGPTFPTAASNSSPTHIWSKLFSLPDDAQVLPGHGPPTTVGHEKRTNPFVGAPAGYKS